MAAPINIEVYSDALVVLGTAGIVVPMVRRFGLSPVLGYLAAGAILGPGAHVVGSLVGEAAEIGEGCEVRGLSVVGPAARIGRGNMLDHGLRVGAGREVPPESLTFS